MPSTKWREEIGPDEEPRFERQAELLRVIQRRNAARAGTSRALHAKHAGCFAAELHVREDVPEHARVGLFAAPKPWRAYVRFSNGSAAHQPDRAPDVRGIAIKVLDVPGPKLLPGLEDLTTQDFLLIGSPSTPFRGSEEFVGLVWAARSKALALPRLLWRFGPGGFGKLVGRLRSSLGVPVHTLAGKQYWSALPTKYGAHAVRWGLRSQVEVGAPEGKDASASASTDHHLRDDLVRRLQHGALEWDLLAQFFEDEARTPIEDASVEWPEQAAPFVPLARLVLPKQDATSADGRALEQTIERLSFDPWHATEDFRPLGEMMRARKVAYKVSAIERKAELDPVA
jgi:catalase